MDEAALLPGEVEPLGDLEHDGGGALLVEAAVDVKRRGERRALDILEHHVRGAVLEARNVDHLDEIRVADARDGAGYALEVIRHAVVGGGLVLEHPERDRSFEGDLKSAPDLRPAGFGVLLDDLIPRNRRGGGGGPLCWLRV